jgi:hypothetical protein
MGFVLPQNAVALPSSKTDDSVVVLRGVPIAIASDVGSAFVSDCARNREQLFSDAQLQEKYDIAPTDWDDIIKNKALRLAISRECERRMLNNDASREAAAKQFTKAPAILGTILENESANPRHRIEAAKELRTTAHLGADRPGDTADRVTVTINLGNAPEDKLVFDCGPPRQTKEATDGETEQW